MKSSLLIISLVACSFFSKVFAHEIKGKKVLIGNGYAYTYVHLNHHKPTSIGIVLSKDALAGLPNVDQVYTLKLPSSAAIPPYNEITINWNAFGHEPSGIYDIPHFDFHFYVISKEERESISCMGDDVANCTKMPAADYLPEFYIPTPAGVPMMGWHWLDSRSPELNGKRFTSTFIYGYYDAEMIFVEPMITREFLLSYGAVDQLLSVPNKYSIDGYYPKRYTLSYDSDQRVYRIALKELVLKDSSK